MLVTLELRLPQMERKVDCGHIWYPAPSIVSTMCGAKVPPVTLLRSCMLSIRAVHVAYGPRSFAASSMGAASSSSFLRIATSMRARQQCAGVLVHGPVCARILIALFVLQRRSPV